MILRRLVAWSLPLLALLLLGSAWTLRLPAAETPAKVSPAHRAGAIEMTFLKAQPGKRAQLVAFLRANWLAMDAKAVSAGLMESYELLEAEDEADPWNVAVMVVYRTPAGYAGVAEEFEQIRKAHQTVLIDGLGLRDLGRIVGSRKVFARTQPG
ncbi:MAG: hypothetical protein JSR82_19315 [Verrucomicrobia bacterium]|nr:hypothetical protein [Verrucomicrobiota bacterium]